MSPSSAYLDELARVRGDAPAEPIVRELLGRSVERLHLLCARAPAPQLPPADARPAQPAVGGAVKLGGRAADQGDAGGPPPTVRQFFALANRHMRWELNDLARRFDEQARGGVAGIARGSPAGAPAEASRSQAGPNVRRILEAIEGLPEEEREVFHLVRLQGMSKPEAAGVVGVSEKTVQRRLSRGLLLLSRTLGDLGPQSPPPAAPGDLAPVTARMTTSKRRDGRGPPGRGGPAGDFEPCTTTLASFS